MPVKDQRRSYRYFAVCPSGAEAALYAELKRGKFGKAEAQVGGAAFAGPASEGWRAVLELRTAVRVLREVGRFPSGDAEALYRGALELPWEEVLTPDMTFAVDAKISDAAIKHTGYAALKVKDAIADRMRKIHGRRPSVDAKNPDLGIYAHAGRTRTVLSVDLGGRPLNRRGYRAGQVEAPISECLAAAAVEYSEWDRKSPFIDPMCGSGTIAIEAAMLAAGMAPGLINPDFAFARMEDFDRIKWEKMLDEARARVKIPPKLIIRGSDADGAAVSAASQNVDAAGLSELVRIERLDVLDYSPRPGWGPVVVSNPPYGKRLGGDDTLEPFFHKLGVHFMSRWKGAKIHLFLPDPRLVKVMTLKPDRYIPFAHGGLEVRLYVFSIRNS